MSNNAAVCPDGSEIGRAQAVQAMAAGLQPAADMNPILLKPEADARSQVVVMGRPWRSLAAGTYYRHKGDLWPVVTGALDRLRQAYELVIIEGAGSPAELNLKEGDIVNMPVARYARAPVLLVGDVDRGGIFAQLLGTLWLLEPEERALVRGLVVNKFRGDPALFIGAVRILEERGGVPVAGVVPYLHDLRIPEEDAVAIENLAPQTPQAGRVDIAVVALPRIANFDDFDPLASEPGVQVRYVSSPQALGHPDAVILPGTKSTMADLDWLRKQRLDDAVRRLAAAGARVVGICGGYQMLGRVIRDPGRVESSLEEVPGLGLLPAETVFDAGKATYRVKARLRGGPGWLAGLADQMVDGYEIHIGRTQGSPGWLHIVERNGQAVQVEDGVAAEEGRVWGCYLHGLFENRALRHAWLASLGWRSTDRTDTPPPAYDAAFNALADAVEAALDMALLDGMLNL
jgi:adenosylcobyric acid synthase